MCALPFHGATGSVVGKRGDDFEVYTELGIRCLVSTDRDHNGDYFVDVPANWLHTEEERHAVILQAQTAVDEWLRIVRETQGRLCTVRCESCGEPIAKIGKCRACRHAAPFVDAEEGDF